jgi:uncharacterized membrane protein
LTVETALAIAAVAFVGSHLLMSHPLRDPMVGAMGTAAFRGVYSLVSFATFGAMLYFYRTAGDQPPLWQPDTWMWTVGAILMWLASILLVGSFRGNPAMVGARRPSGGPAGVFTITRHPMMWSFALWGVVHLALVATQKAAILDGAIISLALVGAAGQDRKKARLMGKSWHDYVAQTAFTPFTRGVGNPGAVAIVGGTLLFLVATWLHPMPVGIWRFFG